MKLTRAAQQRLETLLPPHFAGFALTGLMGTCRGSTPMLSPSNAPESNQTMMHSAGFLFFVNAELVEILRDALLDYDPSLFGKGLTASWPHRSGCHCHHD